VDDPAAGCPMRPSRNSVTHTIPVAATPLYAFLTDLDNHRRFADRHLAVARLDGTPAAAALTTTVTSAGPVDRMLLALGGRLWLRRRMAATLAALAVLLAPTPH
jgi:hypothetical protein